MASSFEIPLDGSSFTIWKCCESFLNDILRSKFGCEASVSGVEGYWSITQMKKLAPVSEKRFEALVSGVKVSVHKADLTNFPVDGVVNAANEGLHHFGGIALALSKAGGSQIQWDSNDHVRKFGVLKTGEAIALPAGLLPCKVIIHAVGPNLSGHSLSKFPQAAQLLESAVVNSLKRAEECSLKSVALPAISSGLFGYPLPQCADNIVKSVRLFCENSQVNFLKEILLVNNDDQTVTEMERACKRIFSAHSVSSSAGNKTAKADHNSTNDTVQLGAVQLRRKQIEELQAFEDEQKRSHQQETFNPPPTKAVTEQQDDGMGASTATITVSGSSEESRQEAYAWLYDILIRPCVMRVIQNNFITRFGKDDYLQLDKMIDQNNVAIEEFLDQGMARLILNGDLIVNVAVAYLVVENMLCKIQKDFVNEEAALLSSYTNTDLKFERREIPIQHISLAAFWPAGLEIVKMESVENPTLERIFGMKKEQMGSFTTRRMLQRIPAHFCDMVSHIGFQAEFAPPNEPAQGQGIYFTGKMSTAMNIWSETVSEYIYFVEAEVLTGRSTPGKPDLILPPPVDVDPLVRYDSLSGEGDISVIFTGYQALPIHIITCKKYTNTGTF